jgi:hypothetical protein
MESRRSSKYQIMLTGLAVADRKAIKKTAQEVILEDINRNPPQKANLVIEKAYKAVLFFKKQDVAGASRHWQFIQA